MFYFIDLTFLKIKLLGGEGESVGVKWTCTNSWKKSWFFSIVFVVAYMFSPHRIGDVKENSLYIILFSPYLLWVIYFEMVNHIRKHTPCHVVSCHAACASPSPCFVFLFLFSHFDLFSFDWFQISRSTSGENAHPLSRISRFSHVLLQPQGSISYR